MNDEWKQQFHPILNQGLVLAKLPSNRVVWWKCKEGPEHSWTASTFDRAKGRGCPYCSKSKVSLLNSLRSNFFQISQEFHPTLNKEPPHAHLLSIGSDKKYWWKCTKFPDHVWYGDVKSRARNGLGCKACQGNTPSISNSLYIENDTFLSELHPTKNINVQTHKLTKGSTIKIWWKCIKSPDHEWLAKIADRKIGNGCPSCRGLKISVTNSLHIQAAELIPDWHPTRNVSTSTNFTAKTNKKVWWKCIKSPDHEWLAPPNARQKGIGCPFCSGRYISVSNSLNLQSNKRAVQWHPILNGSVESHQVGVGSRAIRWWKCKNHPAHVWATAPVSRKGGNTNCPDCSNQSQSGERGVGLIEFPDLVSTWHPTLNAGTSILNVVSGSNKLYWWKCTEAADHVWQASPENRKYGKGCPHCRSLQISITNSLFMCSQSISKTLHPVLNNLSSHQVSIGSNKLVWWKCTEAADHVWRIAPSARKAGRNCPYCSRRFTSITNSFAMEFSNLCGEWHADNLPRQPYMFVSGSHQKILWQCLKVSIHTWSVSILNRSLGRGCPHCNQGWTVEHVRLFIQSIHTKLKDFTQAELYLIFQQSGLLQTQGKAQGFGQVIIDGRLPVSELEKFANNEPSKVDEFVGNTNTLPTEDAGTTVTTETSGESSVATDLNEQDIHEEPDLDKPLPLIKTQQALEALELHQIASSDEEAISFLLASAKAKLWRHAYVSVDEARQQAEDYIGGEYATQVKEAFLNELQAAETLQIPQGYAFKVPGKVDAKLGYTPPLLMQRLCAVRLRDNKRYGNWSGTGAGKTISAILSSRVVDARLTVVCCPNAVVSNWREQILKVFPDAEVQSKTWEPNWKSDSRHRYLIQNYEQFQQVNSEAYIKHFIDREGVELVVIDEIHYAKQRYKDSTKSEKETVSRRKRLVQGMIAGAGELNPNLYVLGMSATPVINNLYEGISLLEMMMGREYADLSDRATVNNCMRLYQQLVTNGTRWIPDYSSMNINRPEIHIDCSEYIPEIRALGKTPSPLALEQILTKARLPTILEHIKPNKKTLIYTHYVDEIDMELCDAIRAKGFKVGFYTGKDKSGLGSLGNNVESPSGFLGGDVDVLIGSSSIGTGVDGLQDVCHTLIINVLPWTNAEYEQLRGRIYRQGSNFRDIDIIIPLTYADVNGERWSYCESKWKRIQFKKSIADAAVDGVVPQGNLRTPAQAQKDLLQWLERLASGQVEPIYRTKITVPLSGEFKDEERRLRKYGDFSTMNGRWIVSRSDTLGSKLRSNPEEWEQYHTLYRKLRESWTVIPYEEMIEWLKDRDGRHLEVGDFGCGEALLAAAVKEIHTVHSFDHVAINDSVVACDMRELPLSDGCLDVGIFSLSLMGTNFTDYLKEAWRVLRLDATLHIWEAQGRFDDPNRFTDDLLKLGFRAFRPEQKGNFVHIEAKKVKREPDDGFQMKFRS